MHPGFGALARSGFSPLSLSGLKGWYVGDRNVTLTSGAVSTWGDLSGSGHDLTDGGASARRPAPIAGGLAGRQTIRFDGVGNYLAATFTLAQPCTVFVVMRTLVVGDLNVHDCALDGATALSGVLGVTTTTASLGTFMYAGAAASDGSTAQPAYQFGAGGFEQGELGYNGASSYMKHHLAGDLLISGDVGAASMGGLTLGAAGGGSRWANVEFAEVLVYNRALTSGEATAVRNYLHVWSV